MLKLLILLLIIVISIFTNTIAFNKIFYNIKHKQKNIHSHFNENINKKSIITSTSTSSSSSSMIHQQLINFKYLKKILYFFKKFDQLEFKLYYYTL